MKPVKPDCKTTAESVQARFEQWRKTRSKRGPIPNELWSVAIQLTEHYSVFYISKLLKLNYATLKNRVADTSSNTYSKDVKAPFIELPSLPSYNAGHCQIDIKRTDGSQMQIRLQNRTQTDLPSLIHSFLG